MSANLKDQLREGIINNLRTDFFEDDEIRALLDEINSFHKSVRIKILSLSLTLSNASSSILPRSLKRLKTVSKTLTLTEFEKWLEKTFEIIDSKGIGPFLSFLSSLDENMQKQFHDAETVFLNDKKPIIELYISAISDIPLNISSNHEPFTDTSTIYLPVGINKFKDAGKNFTLYKITATFLWMQAQKETLLPDKKLLSSLVKNKRIKHPDINHLFDLFEDRRLALDLYNILEAFRHEIYLKQELPGLHREAANIKAVLFKERPELSSLSEKTAFVEGLYQLFLNGEMNGNPPFKDDVLNMLPPGNVSDSFKMLFCFYELTKSLKGDYERREYFFGDIVPEKVSKRLKEQRQINKKRLEAIISKIINMPDLLPRDERMPYKNLTDSKPDPAKDYLLIKGKIIELDEEATELMEEKSLLGGVLVKGSELGGGCAIKLTDLIEEEEITSTGGGIKYDEWDYRRRGYKKNWCSIYEKDIHPLYEPFVEATLKKYSGYVNILKKKFELLKKEPKILRRQREGDNIDIDAAIEALTDMKAGIPPSEYLFTRFDREERNIAVLFLMDMSGSTKGWVNDAEKESLILMCEALETLGDNYAIYGFSGMTRNRCDFYKIKEFTETYSETIKNRISGILPKDYTRMGSPIRHSSNILKSIDARTKLLVIISDGKPEDWDAYKGEYAIEDTKKALIEAKEFGIYPFCITIDREAHSYLPYMFGEINYIFIDDVKKLPGRITEVYRNLTV